MSEPTMEGLREAARTASFYGRYSGASQKAITDQSVDAIMGYLREHGALLGAEGLVRADRGEPDEDPAFETLPSAGEIAEWFLAEKRGKTNVGGDAWWLCRDPHSSCRLLAFVDHDTQEFVLLDVATEGTRDLLWVMDGLDGPGCQWWQNPTSTTNGDPDWSRDGIAWMADQIVVHYEYKAMHQGVPIPQDGES